MSTQNKVTFIFTAHIERIVHNNNPALAAQEAIGQVRDEFGLYGTASHIQVERGSQSYPAPADLIEFGEEAAVEIACDKFWKSQEKPL